MPAGHPAGMIQINLQLRCDGAAPGAPRPVIPCRSPQPRCACPPSREELRRLSEDRGAPGSEAAIRIGVLAPE